MLRVEVVDYTCASGEAYIFHVPIETPWSEINTVVKLLYPTAFSVLIETVPLDAEELK